MQFRMSPGGNMLSSFRRRPLEPPSSLTVTTAERSGMTGAPRRGAEISAGAMTKRFRPFSSVESPVPPPMATTRKSRVRAVFSRTANPAGLVSIKDVLALSLDRFLFANRIVGFQICTGIGIEQFRETRILGQVLEVRIVSRLEAQLSIQTESFIEMAERVFDVAGEALERGQSVDHEVGLGILFEQLIQMLARAHIVANVHQRDG